MGLKPRFNVHKQVDVFVRSIRDYVHLLMGQKEYIVGFLIILATWPKFPRARWYLLAPAGLGFVLYALVHVESRLVGVFFVIFWMTLYSGLQVRSRPVVLAVTILVVSVTAFKIVRAQVSAPRNQGNKQWETAQTLQQNGIEAGSPVAVFGHQNNGDYWAHLGGFRVVADIQTEEMASYWAAPVHVRDNILLRLADELHVRAVVTPTEPLEKGWQPIPNSNYYVKFLETQRR